MRVFATVAEMYASGLIDAVLIATPHRLHVQQLWRRSAQACVLLEADGRFHTGGSPAKRGSGQSGRAFGAMFNQRTNPAYRKMKR
ncbi:MAG: hypothetical protein ACLRUN_14165 [Christensenellales bacterium]